MNRFCLSSLEDDVAVTPCLRTCGRRPQCVLGPTLSWGRDVGATSHDAVTVTAKGLASLPVTDESGIRLRSDLTQVRSAPPTYKRMPHCKDGKHGGGHDDMVSMVEGTVACELPLRTEETTGELAYTGLNQRVLAQQTRRPNASTRQAPDSPPIFWR
ncbi:hypothetical protein B296_00035405 [Ensete ventricosum]|uniref:Uncharacterized protein n=1 Tax=Ensete ventricosum TaxID=4639 RepID=A0A427A021_ENSVE|nr:hypothetical protein B296_00035405 [Ensete ventricosum]